MYRKLSLLMLMIVFQVIGSAQATIKGFPTRCQEESSMYLFILNQAIPDTICRDEAILRHNALLLLAECRLRACLGPIRPTCDNEKQNSDRRGKAYWACIQRNQNPDQDIANIFQ